MQESVFNKVPRLVKVFVVWSLYRTTFLRWYHRLHSLIFGLIEDCVTIVTTIGKQIFCGQPFNQAASLRAIRCGTLCNNDSGRAYHAHPRPDVFWCWAPFCATHVLISAFCPRRMWVNLAMRSINHQPFVIGLVNQDFQQFFPHTHVAPANKATVSIAPATVIWRQITPRRASTQVPETAFTNNLLSLAIPPQLPLRPGKWGSSNAHTASVMSCLRCECVIRRSFRFDKNLTFLISWLHYLGHPLFARRISSGTVSYASNTSRYSGCADNYSLVGSNWSLFSRISFVFPHL